MSLLMKGHQMITSDKYAATDWPESGTKGDRLLVLSIPPFLAPVAFRLAQFLQLGEGWNSYGAHRVSRDAVEAAMSLLVAYDMEVPIPEVFPTAIGGVKLEWGDDNESVEVEFQPDGSISILIDESGEMRESIARNLNDPAVFDDLKWAEKLS
jgi:hypothetical protein